jgi:2-oxoglutarate ferredoxin oxidoreductase subunit delta
MSPGGVGVRMVQKFEVRLLPANCKGCGICVHYCPAGVLEMSGEFTPKGYHPPRKRQGATCTGCRTCELMCPDFAVFIEEPERGTADAAGAPARPKKATQAEAGVVSKGGNPTKRRKAGRKGGIR